MRYGVVVSSLLGHAYVDAAVGGVLIGLASAILLLLNGRIAGCSGIAVGACRVRSGDAEWRWWFLGGLVVGGALMALFYTDALVASVELPMTRVAVAGVLVGIGTRVGNGCTSGHGVCGIGRLSVRSMVATCTFIAAGVITVAVQ